MINFLALGYAPILADLKPFGNSGAFSWNGNTEAKNVEWASGEPSGKGDCNSYNKLGLSSVSCDEPMNFMCETKAAEPA
jgi:hypothetical protein